MQFRVLGSLEVRRGDTAVEIGSPRQRTLLAALLAQAGSVVSVDALTEVLWGAQPPADPRNAIQTYVARLRDALGPDAPIVTRHPGYALEVEPPHVDALRFDQLLAEAHRRGNEAVVAKELLDEALSLWRGPAYAEFLDGPARAEAVRLAERRLAAIEMRAAARLALGEAADLVAELEGALADEPLRERLVALLMEALAALDRQHEALSAYRSYRDRLVEETGLEPSATLRDLEARILRGELGASPAPPRASPGGSPAAPGRSSPPKMPTSLVGRDHDVARLRALLDRERVITLTGPGGVGKTRVAAEVVRPLERAGGEVAWVELAPVEDPAAVQHVIAAVVGIDLAGERPTQEVLLDALAPRALVLVLDNCEHLLAAVAPLVEQLARHGRHVRVLATSRERLAVDGEWVYPLAPLPVAGDADDEDAGGAVRLFLERAEAAGARLDLPDDVPEVAEICRHVDGLPLAIELAAARTGALALRDLLAGLQADAAGGVGQRRGETARHRDLWAVTDWSYRLLDLSEQPLFERLGVFAGAFGADVAHAVCGEGNRAATVEHLAALAERSLLAAEQGSGRYRMLRPLRAFARQRLAERGELEAVADRHARVLTQRAERAAGPPLTEEGRRWLESSLDDLRQVRNHARARGAAGLLGRLIAALYRFDYWRPGAELIGWADDALELPGLTDEPAAPAVYAAAAGAAWRHGDLDRARRLATRGTQLSAGPDDPATAEAFEAAGDVATFEGRLADAERAFREEARLARFGGDPDGEVVGLASTALVLAYSGRTADGIAEADAAVDAAIRAGPAARAFARYAQGECRSETAPQEAIALVEEAAALAHECQAPFVGGVARLTAMSLRGRHGDPSDAVPGFAELIEQWRRSGNWTQQWTTLRNLAELLVRVGADDAAVTIANASWEGGSTGFGRESDRLERALATACARLGQQRYETACRRGRDLRRHDAVDYALAVVSDLSQPFRR